VHILLPPSEKKATEGDGPPLDLASLSFPGLTPARRRERNERGSCTNTLKRS